MQIQRPYYYGIHKLMNRCVPCSEQGLTSDQKTTESLVQILLCFFASVVPGSNIPNMQYLAKMDASEYAFLEGLSY